MNQLATVTADYGQAMQALGLNPRDPRVHALVLIARRYDLDPLLHITIQGDKPYINRDGYLYLAHRSGEFEGIEVRESADPKPGRADERGAREAKCRADAVVYRKGFRPFQFSAEFAWVQWSHKKKEFYVEEFAPERAIARAERRALKRAFPAEIPDDLDAEPTAAPAAVRAVAERAEAPSTPPSDPPGVGVDQPGGTAPSTATVPPGPPDEDDPEGDAARAYAATVGDTPLPGWDDEPSGPASAPARDGQR